MKKGLKKTLAAVIALTMLMSMSVCAFAVELSVTTNYNVATDDISVTASVTGAGADQVAFLAKNGSEIIWIDQQPAVSGVASSTFKTSKANLGAIVNVGTTSVASSAVDGKDAAIALADYEVTINPSENGEVDYVLDETTNVITLVVYPAAGYKLASGTATTEAGTVPVEFINNTKKIAIAADTEFDFTFEKIATAAVVAPAAPSEKTVTADKKSATIAGSAQGAVEYGVLIANDGDEDLFEDYKDVEAIKAIDESTESGVRKYRALGANEAGEYIISLVDESAEFFEKTYKAVLYSVGTTVEFSGVFDLAVSAE